MSAAPPALHDSLPQLAAHLAEQGSLGLVSFDVAPLSGIEVEYGADAYQDVRRRLYTVLEEQRGVDYRADDQVVLDRPGGTRVLLALAPKRRRGLPVGPADVRAARTRLAASLGPALARCVFPYRRPPRLDTGAALVLANPILDPGRQVERALDEALVTGAHLRHADWLSQRERLQELLLRERVVTAYQPIMRLSDRSPLGFEALARGTRGTGFESADALFGAAGEQHLLLELDRLCRSRALLNAVALPADALLFVNTLPATIRDPHFRGRPLIDFLERARLSPERLVLEITEKLVIENYAVFREALAYFVDLGMRFAVDDVGTGYSGLESIARLKPNFLKIDTSLVRDLHASTVNREMTKAILSLGRGLGAIVIAEGIQSEDELRALRGLGVDYGQGFFLARPETAPELT